MTVNTGAVVSVSDSAVGLTPDEVADRVRHGLTNTAAAPTSRSATDIFRTNLFTRFNAVLGALFAGMLIVGPPQDALFGGVLVANIFIGILQEFRSKRLLDSLVIASAPSAHAFRHGVLCVISADAVVVDDVIEVRMGDHVIADAQVLQSDNLEANEALVTGEATPTIKMPGDFVLSGSFIVAGWGRCRVARVGRTAFAGRLAAEARVFKLARSDLRIGIDRVIQTISWALLLLAPALLVSQLRTQSGVSAALRATIAGLAPMVPEGLVLLTSATLAAAILRLGRRHALIQDLAAVETLARVDVICIDKTGTLTDGEPAITAVDFFDPTVDVPAALGALVATDVAPNGTLRALALKFPPPLQWECIQHIPFSSSRRWSAATFAGRGTYVIGAPDVIIAASILSSAVANIMANHVALGYRVLLFARTEGALTGSGLPVGLQPLALIALGEHIRSDATEILRYFAAQGVTVKIISGDNPVTVGVVALQVGVPIANGPIDARTLPTNQLALAEMVEGHQVFGRASPDAKRAIVEALQARGHVVAMTGDGVNDVLALKQADIGIAMGSGTSAARAVSQLILTDSRFGILPLVVGEGRRVVGNVERLAALFLTKSVFVVVMALAIAVASLPFPFLSRHLTLVGALTIGIPALILSLIPNSERVRPDFLKRVGRTAIAAGIAAAAAAFIGYAFILVAHGGTELQAQSAATTVLLAVSLWVIVVVARPLDWLRVLVVIGAAFTSFVVYAVPALRRFFALEPLVPLHLLTSLVLAAAAIVLLETILASLSRQTHRRKGY